MKRTFIILLFSLLAGVVYAGEKQNGNIITKKGYRLNVEISIYDQGIILTGAKIKYFLAGKKRKIPLSQITRIELGSKVYEVISFKKHIKTGPSKGTVTLTVLAELINDGNVKLYRSYRLQSNGYSANGVYYSTGSRLISINYLAKGELVKRASRLDFKKRMRNFFPDCDLITKVEYETFKYKDIEQAIEYGNKNCKK